MRGLPYNVSLQDILNFFQGFPEVCASFGKLHFISIISYEKQGYLFRTVVILFLRFIFTGFIFCMRIYVAVLDQLPVKNMLLLDSVLLSSMVFYFTKLLPNQ